jgi:N-acetylglutamate synthase-like GNAT family acetyltransferase
MNEKREFSLQIRPAADQDMPTIRRLAEAYALDTERLEADQFLVAVERGQIVGFGRLKPYPDAVELGCLGVVPERRRNGIARQLIEHLLARVDGDVYVTTDLPEFARRLGFVETEMHPYLFWKKCEGSRDSDERGS